MPYAAELDDLRQEVRLSVASTIVFWPKLDGTGNAVAAASGNTVEILKPDGTTISGPSALSPTDVSGVSRFDLSIPAISELGEDYFAKVTWRENGTTFDRLETVYFDVCREPWGPSSVSLNSMQSLVPDIGDRITRQGARLSQTAVQRASVLGHQARVELGEWLRAAVSEDTARMSSVISSTVLVPNYDAYLRPRLIKDKARLHTIEVKLAIALAYKADLRSESADDAIHALYKHWLEAAKTSFRGMGSLKYDLDDSLVVDTKANEVGRYTPMRRVQS